MARENVRSKDFWDGDLGCLLHIPSLCAAKPTPCSFISASSGAVDTINPHLLTYSWSLMGDHCSDREILWGNSHWAKNLGTCLANWKPQILISSLTLEVTIWSTLVHLSSTCLYALPPSSRLETWNWGVHTVILTPVCTTLHIQIVGQWGDDLLPCLSCAESFVDTFRVTAACFL